MPLLFRSGLLFAFTAVCLQIAVFLQPLLPKQYQIAPVCETITKALLLPQVQAEQSQSQHHAHHHSHQLEQAPASASSHDHHDPNHQCQYCVVYAHVVPLPDIRVKEILVRVQVRLLAFKEAFFHIFFILNQLFILFSILGFLA